MPSFSKEKLGTTKDATGHWFIPLENLKKPPVPDWHYRSAKSKRKAK